MRSVIYMELRVKNVKISPVIQLLDKLPLKGLKSIHRTRLSQQLGEKLERVIEEEREIKKELCHLDEDGNPKVNDDGTLDVKDREEFNKVMREFLDEEVVIDGGDSQIAMKSVKQSLEESEVEFEGEEAYTFAYLYDAFVTTNKEEGSKENGDE